MARNKSPNPRADNLRRLVANEAARIMAEQGIEDFFTAKRKAAERLGVSDRGSLPRNTEIEAALAENQRLFAGESHGAALRSLRETALHAMTMLGDFNPRAVGAALTGLVTPGSDVDLHVFAESAELVALRLMHNDIPYRLTEKRMRTHSDQYQFFPAYRFEAGARTVELTVFPTNGIRQPPLSPSNGRPMERASAPQLKALLES